MLNWIQPDVAIAMTFAMTSNGLGFSRDARTHMSPKLDTIIED